jgi:hypothetical protein
MVAAADEAPSPAVPSELDQFCNAVTTSTKDKPARLFSAMRKEGEKRAPWREFASERALRAKLQSADEFQVAEFRKQDDGAATVSITSGSDTGDWSHVVEYCYRADGNLARTSFTFQSFVLWGGVHGTRKRYFDSAGTVVSTSTEVRSLQANKLLAKREYPEQEATFLRLTDLPFASLLSAPSDRTRARPFCNEAARDPQASSCDPEAVVGQWVVVEGRVGNNKITCIEGAALCFDHSGRDLHKKRVRLRGLVRKVVVTEAEVAENMRDPTRMVAMTGPGTTYWLVNLDVLSVSK